MVFPPCYSGDTGSVDGVPSLLRWGHWWCRWRSLLVTVGTLVVLMAFPPCYGGDTGGVDGVPSLL